MPRKYPLTAAGLEKISRTSSERMKRLHADPEFAKVHAMRGRLTMMNLRADPEFMAKQTAASSKFLKQKWQDPEYRTARTEEARARMNAAWAALKEKA